MHISILYEEVKNKCANVKLEVGLVGCQSNISGGIDYSGFLQC